MSQQFNSARPPAEADTVRTSAGVTATERDLDSARRVLGLEISALQTLADGLDDVFVAALDLISGVSGRTVVTGMGKSGHIARKIAATLASTGTPSLFVHPAEASHGDLGMIERSIDAVVALSNSGETPELVDIISYAKRYGNPLIAITGNKNSALARAADAALILPGSGEACPMGLAPTTSTTLMLGLGDAIAVALLERNGFSSDEFQVLHPGGQLGRRLLRICDIMHEGDVVPLAPENLSMADALVQMTAKSFGCIGVTGADGRLLGIVTDGDLRRHMSPELISRSVADVMTSEPTTIGADEVANKAVQIMNANSITTLFVVDDGRPVGIVHIHDCLRAGVA